MGKQEERSARVNANAAGGEPATQADDSQEDTAIVPRHAPEPWRVVEDTFEGERWLWIEDANGEALCSFSDPGLGVTDYHRANARRIVAAINKAGAARATTEQIETIAMRWMGQEQTS